MKIQPQINRHVEHRIFDKFFCLINNQADYAAEPAIMYSIKAKTRYGDTATAVQGVANDVFRFNSTSIQERSLR
jgi:hypothetical protein